MNEEEKKAIEILKEIEINTYAEGKAIAIDTVLKLIKKLQKENEELKEEKINNYRMIALAQNEALGYMQGYEDGKKLKKSATASIIENQQYYIIQKQMEKYEEHIKRLQKENEELKEKLKEENELNKIIKDTKLNELFYRRNGQELLEGRK